MTGFRALLRNHRALALLLIAAALAMKALVPAGFMIGTESRTITVEICADTLGAHLTKTIAVPFTGKSQSDEHGKGDGTCPFGGLAMAALGGADPVLLAAAMAFILALGFAPPRILRASSPARLRPPLRAPPAIV